MNKIQQQVTDHPQDRAIKIITSDQKKLCYAPFFGSKGIAYIYLDYCSSQDSLSARYDVFQRIAYKINNEWLCITAPSTVTGSEYITNWDYVTLAPCALNDSNQRWIVKDDAFYTADSKFRLKDYKYYLYISRNPNDYYDHTLDSSMKGWINTIASPPTLTIKTTINWTYTEPTIVERYYLNSINYSELNRPNWLYYNTENNRIYDYQFDLSTERYRQYCMYSTQIKGQEWNWIGWQLCDDTIPQTKDSMSWTFFTSGLTTMIADQNNNILRVTKTGNKWGYPYTATSEYIKKDTANLAESFFSLHSYDIEQWIRYYYGNIGRTLDYCPADVGGIKKDSSKAELKTLPPSFRLTDQWFWRLYQITITSTGSGSGIGLCGTCFIQSLQMVAELDRYAYSGPLTSGGYFFDTEPRTDPIINFRQRNPLLAERLEFSFSIAQIQSNIITGSSGQRLIRRVHAVFITMLPQYSWTNNEFQNGSNIDDYLNTFVRLFNAPTNTVWVLLLYFYEPSSTTPDTLYAHVQVLIRTSEGIVTVPTADSWMTYQNFRNALANPATNPDELYEAISFHRTRDIRALLASAVERHDELSYNTTVSNNDCTGLGEHRRGNGNRVTNSTINKCLNGRCSLQ